jgi:hypothetical protein
MTISGWFRPSTQPRFAVALYILTLFSIAVFTWYMNGIAQSITGGIEVDPGPGRIATTPPSVERVVFFNIFIPVGEYRQHGINIVKEQLDRISQSSHLHDVAIHYILIGGNATTEIQEICPKCRQLRYAQQGDEVLTLGSLFDYCRAHPQSQVTYAHNKGSFHPSEANDNIRVMLTKSIVSSACQDMPPDTCNLCTARFSPSPHFHCPGNMWTASCSYIQNLIPPQSFEAKMEDLHAFLNGLENTTLIPRPNPSDTELWKLGRQRYSMEHWVGSHPFAKPCDVYPGPYHWAYEMIPLKNASWTPTLAAAPRFALEKVPNPEGPWFCGQGKLVEFDYLYDQRPLPDSYFWTYFAEQEGSGAKCSKEAFQSWLQRNESIRDIG